MRESLYESLLRLLDYFAYKGDDINTTDDVNREYFLEFTVKSELARLLVAADQSIQFGFVTDAFVPYLRPILVLLIGKFSNTLLSTHRHVMTLSSIPFILLLLCLLVPSSSSLLA